MCTHSYFCGEAMQAYIDIPEVIMLYVSGYI